MAGGRLIRAVAEVNTTRRPEHDVTLRVAVLVAVMAGALAVLFAGAAPLGESTAIVLVMPLAFLWSHRRRNDSNWAAKIVISVLAVAVLIRFFDGLSGITTVDDARRPLSVLFLEIQVLHSFDLPQRRDLMFGLVSSLALLGLALATGPGAWMFVLFAVHLSASAVALHRHGRSRAQEWAEDGVVGPPVDVEGPAVPEASPARATGRSVAAVAAVAVLLFGLLPLRSSGSLGGLPFSFGSAGPAATTDNGRIQPPFADGGGPQGGGPVDYFGFADRVDPRSVGDLDDTPIMRVRTDRPRPLRGVVFDVYDDGVWGRSGTAPRPVQGLPVVLRQPRGEASVQQRVTQTIELLHATPNLVFAASDPREVWLAARSVSPWDDGTLTTSVDMSAGTVYSVVSAIDVTPASTLRTARPGSTGTGDPRWTALPDSVPQRVHDLARQLAEKAAAPTPYAIAETVQAWIGDRVAYSLEGPVVPRSADPVDHLLFESRVGWCEPIATSMVVLLRSLGIPARFVTGFQPGTRDLFSGQYVVRAADAHAWVEVEVPGVGWVPFDPTGATSQVLDPEGMPSEVLIVRLLGRLHDAVSADPWPWVAGAGGAVVLAGAGWMAAAAVAARRLRRQSPWVRLLAALEAEGVAARPSDTPREAVSRANRTLPHLDRAGLDLVRAHEEARRYAAPGPDEESAHAAVDRILTRR